MLASLFATPAKIASTCWLFVFLLCSSLAAQENSDCLGCHEDPELTAERDGKTVPMFFDAERFKLSVHASVDCIACHTELDGVKDFPHKGGKLKAAECGNCHDPEIESMAAYWGSTHGKGVTEGNLNAPRCQDCHGSHFIGKRSESTSPVYTLNIPATCSVCHAEGQKVERGGALTRDQVEARYKDSIHGPGLFKQGLKVAPNCVTCHSGHGVLPHTDTKSLTHKDKVNDGCAQCHNSKEEIHKGIVAVELWSVPGAVPLCVDCHQPHGHRSTPYGTGMSDGECMQCHGDEGITQRTGKKALFVDSKLSAHSVHTRNQVACAQCHSGVRPVREGRPCQTVQKVNCAACHEQQVSHYERGIHGSLAKKGEKEAPTCVSCHGSHTILESAVPAGAPAELRHAIQAGPTHRRNVPDLCANCHKDGGDASLRTPETEKGKIEHYRDSVHGKGLLESGLIASANCVDCHSAHMELPPADPASTVAPENIVHTCGKCHDGIHEHLRNSVHSREANPDYKPGPGQPKLPDCNDCHTAHSVARTDLPGFRQTIVDQCGKCHAEITETYFDTYHGKASKLGNEVAARCHDCHGSHGILPKDAKGSTLHADHIVGTCAQCHPNSNVGFTGFLAHATHSDKENHPQLYWAFMAMTWLLIGTFGFFGLHLIAWLPKSWQLRRQHRLHTPTPGAKEYQRFTPWNRMLHVMIITSFLGLALTGMALKFSEAAWARVLADVLGGAIVAGWIHRVCAGITFLYFVLHIYDLVQKFRKSGQSAVQFFTGPDSMTPRWRDVTDMIGTFKWFFGLGPRPRYGKWTYWEKFDYFAVFWGVGVIGLSGLILWFPEAFTLFLPGWIINVATIIHSEEALLATGFIFTIHFFNTHMRPEKFPMDRVVFTGRMTVEELKADKPGLYDELVAKGELDKYLVDPPTPFARRAATVFGTIALTIGVIVIGLIIHGLLTVGL
ncbi:MAG: hypothetical protein JNN13_01940 [Planctomycetes bacterium]|nr:hypothetical protein [Planctomycetota bacterium]